MFKRITTVLLIAAAAAIAAVPEGVPKEATETAPGVYRLVDKDGKAWVYRKTPFGISKKAEESAPAKDVAPAAAEGSRMTPFGETKARSPYAEEIEKTAAANPRPAPAPVATKVTEDGDILRFERPSPFGAYKWSKHKDELTTDEKRIWESQRSTAPGKTAK